MKQREALLLNHKAYESKSAFDEDKDLTYLTEVIEKVEEELNRIEAES